MLYLAAAAVYVTDARREKRWRRFINVLAPIAEQTQNLQLLRLVRENADLLEQKNVSNFV